MKLVKHLILCNLLLLITINPIIADDLASISIDTDLNITFNIPNITYDNLIDDEKYLTMVTFNNGTDSYNTYLYSIQSINDIPSSYLNTNISITIKLFDPNSEEDFDDPESIPEHGSFTIPTLYLTTPVSNNYEFELDDTSIIDTILITGNELNTRLFLVNDSLSTLFNQSSNKITISKDIFKDFSNIYDTCDISFISNGNVVTTITNLKLTSDVLKKSLVNKTFSISNDINNIYANIKDADYLNNITYIHVYGVDSNDIACSYIIGDHIGYGIDNKAYDLTSVKSLLSLIPIDNQKELLPLNNPLSIPIPSFYNKYPKLGIDIYANGYVTLHKFYSISKPSNSSSSNNEEIKEEENNIVEVEHIHKVPDTGVR